MLETVAWIAVGATLLPAVRAARASRPALVALIGVGAVAIVLAVLAAVATPTWLAIAQEDGPIEWATFFAFAFAAVWLVAVVRKQGSGPLYLVATLLLAAFCIVVAGEEISWGQRLLGFQPPDLFLERNFQQELNVHNVLMNERGLGFALESKHLVIAIALGFGFAWPWLVARERFRGLAPLAPPFTLAPIFLGIVAVQLDYPVELTGEGAELITGLAFFAAALLARPPTPKRLGLLLATPLVLGWIMSVVVTRVLFGSDAEGTELAKTELVALQHELGRAATPKLRDRNIHKRVFTAIVDGYLQLDRPRTDRHGYYLDPWNNPYWIVYDRKTASGAIYSFGPNRRRDLSVKRPNSALGDDIVITFQLTR